jgi:ABC-type Fe3+ transport system permease subunit
MRFDIGSIIAIVAALIFYLRLIILQRQRSLTQRAKPSGDHQENGRNANNSAQIIRWNWVLVGLGILLIGIGAVFSVSTWPGIVVHSLWWIPVTGGILLMTLSIR